MTIFHKLVSRFLISPEKKNEIGFCTDLDDILRDDGKVTLKIDGNKITLDLSNLHERRYAACLSTPLRYPQYDIDNLLMAKFVRKGDRILDGGANIGLTALHFLHFGASFVECVEALPWLAERIRGIDDIRISVTEAALSKCSDGFVDIAVSKTHNQGSTYDSSVIAKFSHIFGDDIKFLTTPTITIDSLASGPFDIWKLDVEGAEIDVVNGALQSLKNCPPRAIFTEFWDERVHEFASIVSASHPVVYRAGITKDNYQLKLLDMKTFEKTSKEFFPISPTYVFLRADCQEI
ncbi:FkbM family methyltransferase [Brucella gallinifaecis]|uniref:FkbM family methyltransferase n=1 Tax=Brucella gallinifaecis TaxID=215590 RepID=A0A502BPY4_9HYPH|nr:FkbM family methyltransferase [Brucella gallinifaecis]TPF75208.1 FkbM family methyltransferase [Brucella gallinifaecis]